MACGLFGLFTGAASLPAQVPVSSWVVPAGDGRLLYRHTLTGDSIPESAAAGYRGGKEPRPSVPIAFTVHPDAGDDTTRIQAAIDEVAALTPDAMGFRGAVLLKAGEYQVESSLYIRTSGIVLRGEGNNEDSGTRLRATGTDRRSLIVIGSPTNGVRRLTRPYTVADPYVPIGARSLRLTETEGLVTGEQIILHRPGTAAWIHTLGMDQLAIGAWTAEAYDVDLDRRIMRIEGDQIFLDAPVTCALDQLRGYGEASVHSTRSLPTTLAQIGVEHIFGLSDYRHALDEDHAWTFIETYQVEDLWIHDVTAQHFVLSCVHLNRGTRRATVSESFSRSPVSPVTESRRFAFLLEGAQASLVRDCIAYNDRHPFATRALTHGPNVFVDCHSVQTYKDAGPHQRWATGGLWDVVHVNGKSLDIENRGNLGSGQGWAGANCCLWNCEADSFTVQSPPTAANWLIGGIGALDEGTRFVGPHAPGIFSYSGRHGRHVYPRSLYQAQLRDRLCGGEVQVREYVVGDFDRLLSPGGQGDSVPVDPAWLNRINPDGKIKVHPFDYRLGNAYVPWTHTFKLDPGDEIIAATLLVAVYPVGDMPSNDRIYLDALEEGLRVVELATSIDSSGAAVLSVDLGDRLTDLEDGSLHLAVLDDIAVDWSKLILHVVAAPGYPRLLREVPPVFDSSVGSETYAHHDYREHPLMGVRTGPASSGVSSWASYLQFDLADLPPDLRGAHLQLHCIYPGDRRQEHALAWAPRSDWSEAPLTWSTRPPTGITVSSWLPQRGNTTRIPVGPWIRQAREDGESVITFKVYAPQAVAGDGWATYASSENENPSLRPCLIVEAANTPPVLSPVPDFSIPVNTVAAGVTLSLGDAETAPGDLSANLTVSDEVLFPSSGITLTGTGPERQLRLTPASHQLGTATFTIGVSDGLETRETHFAVRVTGTPIEQWRHRHWGTTAQLGDAADDSDPDGDRFTNAQEFICDTHPKQMASCLRISGTARSPNRVLFHSSTNRMYTLQYRASPTVTDAWRNVPGQVQQRGIGAGDQLIDPASPRRGSYRIQVSLP